MHRFATAAVAGFAVLALTACSFGDSGSDQPGIAGQGSGNARTYPVADFDSIDLRGSDDVEVRIGSGFSVRAEGDSDVLDRLRITREGQALRIDRRNDNRLHFGGGDAKVLVTMPRIVAARIAGSGDISVDRADGERFEGSLAGSGNLTVSAMRVGETRLSIAGSGDIQAAGKTGRLEVSIAGSGSLEAGDLEATSAKVRIAGSGDVRAALDGEGDVRIAGSGDVDLGEKARCTVRATGSGTVRCGG